MTRIKEIEAWILTPKKGLSKGIPMGRYHSFEYRNGIRKNRLCVAWGFEDAKFFETKEDALLYLSNKFDKYGEQINEWKPKLFKTQKGERYVSAKF